MKTDSYSVNILTVTGRRKPYKLHRASIHTLRVLLCREGAGIQDRKGIPRARLVRVSNLSAPVGRSVIQPYDERSIPYDREDR